MSRDTTATPAGPRAGAGRQQASLRDHLNERVAPFLKRALIDGLKNDVEYPLQWLGEHLIHLSMLHEGNPDSTNIKAHFKYDHDAPPPPPPPEPVARATAVEIKSEDQPRENTGMSNGIGSVETQPTFVNGTGTMASSPPQGAPAVPAAVEEMLPGISEAAAAHASEDTEMQGAP